MAIRGDSRAVSTPPTCDSCPAHDDHRAPPRTVVKHRVLLLGVVPLLPVTYSRKTSCAPSHRDVRADVHDVFPTAVG